MSGLPRISLRDIVSILRVLGRSSTEMSCTGEGTRFKEVSRGENDEKVETSDTCSGENFWLAGCEVSSIEWRVSSVFCDSPWIAWGLLRIGGLIDLLESGIFDLLIDLDVLVWGISSLSNPRPVSSSLRRLRDSMTTARERELEMANALRVYHRYQLLTLVL